MSYWAYMLHCEGGSYYTGHTDNLEVRLAQHRDGSYGGFTSEHLPVKLVWYEKFPSRAQAFAAEQRIKGWSRAKKMALIRRDWEDLSRLAKGKGKDDPSTSTRRETGRAVGRRTLSETRTLVPAETAITPHTARPVSRRVDVEGLSLLCHADTPSREIRAVSVEIRMTDGYNMLLTFKVDGVEFLHFSPQNFPERRDNLWLTTCFEVFLKPFGADPYFEFNFSPSTQWAAYHFERYRHGMVDQAMAIAPHIERGEEGGFVIEVDLDLSDIPPGPFQVAFSAVIEEKNGTKSYWALKHPPGKPDFHHPDCFALTLAPPEPR